MPNCIIMYRHDDPIAADGPFSRWFTAEHPYHEPAVLTSVSFDRDVTEDEQAAVRMGLVETDRFWNDHGPDGPKGPRQPRHVAIDSADEGGYIVTAHDGDLEAGTPVAAATFDDVCKAIQAALQLPK